MNGDTKNTRSYIMLITSMIIYGTIGIFRRYIPLSSSMLAFSRGVLGAGSLYLFVRIRGKKLSRGIGKQTLLLLLLSGLAMGVNWILLFEAYNYTTVATATLCYYMQPSIVILLSPIVFREKLTAKKLICALVAVIGMVFVSGVLEGGGGPGSDFRGILCGLGAGALYAAVVILNKMIKMEDALERTIIQLASAAVVLIPYILLTEEFSAVTLDATAVLMILIVGILHTAVAYALFFASMDRLKAQSVAVLSYIDPVSALLASALILHESMTVFGIIGAVLIIGSAVVSET